MDISHITHTLMYIFTYKYMLLYSNIFFSVKGHKIHWIQVAVIGLLTDGMAPPISGFIFIVISVVVVIVFYFFDYSTVVVIVASVYF